MGSVCSGSGISQSSSAKVKAPAHVAWQVITDVDSYPSFLSHVKAVERNDETSSLFQVGTRTRVTREYYGREMAVCNTITAIGNDPRCVSVGSSFQNENGWREVIENTSTITVLPIDDTSCQLVLTYGSHPAQMSGVVRDYLCRPCLLRQGRMVLEDELADFLVETERRYAEQKELSTG